MAEYTSMVEKDNYEIRFQTKNYDEYKEMQEAAREIIDRNSQKSDCENGGLKIFEYIERNDLLAKINENPAEGNGERCAQILEAILEAPTADVEPVVKCDVCLYQGKCTVEEAFDTARFPDSKKFCAVGVANRIKEKNGR